MTRIPLPEGHNHTTARHPRTSIEAFGCDACDAVAMFKPRPQTGLVLAAGLWAFAIGACVAAVWLQINF